MSKAGKALLKAARDAARYARTGVTDGSVSPVTAPDTFDVKGLRKQWNMTQAQFADFIRVKVATVRDWEQHRRKPGAAASALFTVLEQEPAAAIRALGTDSTVKATVGKGRGKQSRAGNRLRRGTR
jgi:putative transcriptional regulator